MTTMVPAPRGARHLGRAVSARVASRVARPCALDTHHCGVPEPKAVSRRRTIRVRAENSDSNPERKAESLAEALRAAEEEERRTTAYGFPCDIEDGE